MALAECRKTDRDQGLSEKAKDCFTKAHYIWERIIKELPSTTTTAQAYHFAAECYRRMDQYDKAKEYYQQVVNNWPDSDYGWKSQLQIAQLYKKYQRLGTMTKSDAWAAKAAAFEHLIEIKPDCPAAGRAQKWLNSYNKSQAIKKHGNLQDSQIMILDNSQGKEEQND